MSGYVLLFTTQAVFACEKILKTQGINVRLVSTPRQFSSDCGIAAYFWGIATDKVAKLLESKGLEFEIHPFSDPALES